MGGRLLREGMACDCPWTAKVCPKVREAEVHRFRFPEVETCRRRGRKRGGRSHRALPGEEGRAIDPLAVGSIEVRSV